MDLRSIIYNLRAIFSFFQVLFNAIYRQKVTNSLRTQVDGLKSGHLAFWGVWVIDLSLLAVDGERKEKSEN